MTVEPLVLHVDLKREAVPAFDRYPFSIPSIRRLERIVLHPEVTVIVGENGSGKSTFVEAVAIAAGFNAEGGSANFRFRSRPSHSELHRYIRLVRRRPLRHGFFLRAESFFNFATNIEELDREPAAAPRIIDSYGGSSLHEQSHGESFMALLHNRFGPGGFYVLDEPEAALSPRNQVRAVGRIRELARVGAQFLIATHSPIFTAYPGAFVYEFNPTKEPPINRIEWENADHVQVLREFLTTSQVAKP
ncbi:MAG TPA: AAA family ATPase [Polyangiaceae bacterium]|nr:AAA family ATPase [Polyangiaceae bacterium]